MCVRSNLCMLLVNVLSVGEFIVYGGSLFHSHMVRGKYEYL